MTTVFIEAKDTWTDKSICLPFGDRGTGFINKKNGLYLEIIYQMPGNFPSILYILIQTSSQTRVIFLYIIKRCAASKLSM